MRTTIDPKNFFLLPMDPRARLRFLIQFGGEAPSSHNTQPWYFKILSSDNGIEVYGDEARALPLSDPATREFFISIGCSIENILVAADYYGLPAHATYFPDPKLPFLVARIMFDDLSVTKRPPDEAHILLEAGKRHANRETFIDDRPLAAEFIASAQALEHPGYKVSVVSEISQKERLAKIVSDATYAAFKDKNFCLELSHWIKPSTPKYPDGMPGYNLGIPWPISFIVPLAIRYGDVADQQRKMVEKMLTPVSSFIVISTEHDAARDYIEVGRILERIWLTASGSGLKMGLFGAPIEIGNFYTDVQKVLGLSYRPQIFCRLGYASKTPPQSPRRSIDAIIR